jgi:hypothetical protein
MVTHWHHWGKPARSRGCSATRWPMMRSRNKPVTSEQQAGTRPHGTVACAGCGTAGSDAPQTRACLFGMFLDCGSAPQPRGARRTRSGSRLQIVADSVLTATPLASRSPRSSVDSCRFLFFTGARPVGCLRRTRLARPWTRPGPVATRLAGNIQPARRCRRPAARFGAPSNEWRGG